MEVWKQVPIAPNYEASTLGRIRNIKTKRILSVSKNMFGYLKACIRNEYKRLDVVVHRVVAMTFIPNPEGKPSVDHKNRIRDDNRVDNLRWATPKEQNNNRKRQRTDKNGNERAIWKCDPKTGNRIEKFQSITRASKSITLDKNGPSNIFAAAKRNEFHGILKYTSYGFIWEYDRIVILGEEWKDLEPKHINGEKGYKISSEGRIKLPNGRIKSTDGNEDIYPKIYVNKRGFRIHRLVALTFIPNDDPEKGVFIAEFPSIQDAAKKLGVKVVNPHNKTSCNSQWRFKTGDERPITDVSQDPKIGKKYRIKQFDMRGVFIQEFNSFTEACLSLGLGKRIYMGRSSSYNFQWRRSEFDDRPLLDLSHRDKKIKIE